jgi:hypothetical protein
MIGQKREDFLKNKKRISKKFPQDSPSLDTLRVLNPKPKTQTPNTTHTPTHTWHQP